MKIPARISGKAAVRCILPSLFSKLKQIARAVNRLYELDAALASVRVADPAVGSGAFPLGILNEIVRARQNITKYLCGEEISGKAITASLCSDAHGQVGVSTEI